MASRPLRVAVVGVGHLGRIHAKIYAENPDAELCYVVDTDEEAARTVAAEVGAQALGDPADLPADLDAVSVVVPTVAHATVAVPLLERGVACLVEKPLAPDLEQADRILAAAEKGGATLAVGHVERFQPGVRKVREMGLKPGFIECHRLSSFSFRSTDVGVVHDLMIHDLDLLLHLVDSEVESFDAVGGKILTQSEDVASVRLIFANGARANVTASRASLSPMRRFRMFSPSSYVALDFTKNQGLLVLKGPEFDAKLRELYELDPTQTPNIADMLPQGLIEITELELGGEERPLQAELASFLASVRERTEPEVTGADGRRALELAERIRAAIVAQPW